LLKCPNRNKSSSFNTSDNWKQLKLDFWKTLKMSSVHNHSNHDRHLCSVINTNGSPKKHVHSDGKKTQKVLILFAIISKKKVFLCVKNIENKHFLNHFSFSVFCLQALLTDWGWRHNCIFSLLSRPFRFYFKTIFQNNSKYFLSTKKKSINFFIPQKI
jgi:hypothetical protein